MLSVQRREWHLKWVATAALAAAVLVLYVFSPERYSIYPQCLFLKFSGFECPGCGSLRSVHYLVHGEFWAAFRLNPLLYILLPVIVLCRHRLHKPAWLWSVAAIVAGFTIARNL